MDDFISVRDWRRKPPLRLCVTKKLDIHWCWIKCSRCPHGGRDARGASLEPGRACRSGGVDVGPRHDGHWRDRGTYGAAPREDCRVTRERIETPSGRVIGTRGDVGVSEDERLARTKREYLMTLFAAVRPKPCAAA